jgi:hypothetical protein
LLDTHFSCVDTSKRCEGYLYNRPMIVHIIALLFVKLPSFELIVRPRARSLTLRRQSVYLPITRLIFIFSRRYTIQVARRCPFK